MDLTPEFGDELESTTVKFEWTLRGIKNLFESTYVLADFQTLVAINIELQERGCKVKAYEIWAIWRWEVAGAMS
jgi:hypothetical protein